MDSTSTEIAAPQSPANAFRAKASGLMTDAAHMTLHQLVDEYVRLCEVVEANSEADPEQTYRKTMNATAKAAYRERQMINVAARSRFGLTFEPFDRDDDGDSIF